MNAHNAHEYLPLVRALADGKRIQSRYKIDSDWYEEAEIVFNGPIECYRIKPEPRTFEMWLIPSGVMFPIETVIHPLEGKRITVQEVL